MGIYFVYYFSLLGIGFFLHVTGLLKSKGGRVTYLGLVWLVLTLIGGLRSISISYDGYAYSDTFDYFAGTPWKLPWEYSYFMEYGFYVLCKVISVLGGTYRTMFFRTSGFTVFTMCHFLHKNTDNLLFSTLLFLSYPYFYTSFDLIRYYLALSVVLLAYDFVKERRFYFYLICIIIAMLFHKTAVFMLVLYWLPKIKWNVFSITGVVAITILAVLFPHRIVFFLSNIFNDYKSYVSGSNTHWFGNFSGGIKTALMYFALLVISFLAFQNKNKSDSHNNLCLGYVMIVVALAFVYINASIAIRFIVAFLPFMSIGLSSLLDDKGCYNQGMQVFLRYVTVMICIAYHSYLILNDWQNIVPYAVF